MSTNQTTRAFPSTRIAGRLAADPAEHSIPAKGDKPATPVLEFDLAVNPTREGLNTVYVRCSIIGAKRVEKVKGKLTKGQAVELHGDLKVRAYTHENQARTEVGLEVAFGDAITFGEKGEKPTKTPLFPKEEAAS